MGNDLSNTSPIPLSAVQQRLWVLEQLHPKKGLGLVGVGMDWKGPLDLAALESATNELLARHEILRCDFQVVNRTPVQVVSATARVDLASVDLRGLQESEQASRVRLLLDEGKARALDLGHAPVLRLTHI